MQALLAPVQTSFAPVQETCSALHHQSPKPPFALSHNHFGPKVWGSLGDLTPLRACGGRNSRAHDCVVHYHLPRCRDVSVDHSGLRVRIVTILWHSSACFNFLREKPKVPPFLGVPLFYKAAPRQFQPPTCKLTPSKIQIGKGRFLCISIRKPCRLEGVNSFFPENSRRLWLFLWSARGFPRKIRGKSWENCWKIIPDSRNALSSRISGTGKGKPAGNRGSTLPGACPHLLCKVFLEIDSSSLLEFFDFWRVSIYILGCQFALWRLKLSWGCFIEKGWSPKRVVLWQSWGKVKSMPFWGS